MRSLSNIIKGQRVRSESVLNIKKAVKPFAPEDKDKNLNTEKKEIRPDSFYKLEQTRLRIEQENLIIIEEATTRAKQIVADAKAKIEEEASIALEKAKHEGYTAGYKKGELESKVLIDQAQKIVEKAKHKKEIMLKQLEPEIIEMIIAICQKLINEEVEFNQSTIHSLIRKSLGNMKYEMTDVKIKVSPDQYESVLENKDMIIQDYANPSDVKIWQEADLKKGACIIETPFGSVECNIDAQFDEIKKQMRLLSDKE